MTEESLSPTDAFGLLADETRLAIVDTLVDCVFQSLEDPISFSELRRRVGVRDAGKFNYHLKKLQPVFVEKQDDGYMPRFAALEASGAARAGTLTDLPDERSGEIDIDCHECGQPLHAIHRGSSLRIECADDGWYFQNIVPPQTATDRPLDELVRYSCRDTSRQIEKLVDGVCMICGGVIDTTVPSGGEAYDDESTTTVEMDCTHCAFRTEFPVGVALIRHPAVLGHHWEHGVDLRDNPLFTPEFIDPEYTTVESTDPFEAVVDVVCEGDSLQVRIDGDLNAEVL